MLVLDNGGASVGGAFSAVAKWRADVEPSLPEARDRMGGAAPSATAHLRLPGLDLAALWGSDMVSGGGDGEAEVGGQSEPGRCCSGDSVRVVCGGLVP